MPRNKGTKSIPVETLKHKDKRANIPTEELRDFVAEEEKQPKTRLYPRDPSLDPQLVWKGKDEQDSKDLAVPVVPVYIQEKIHPQALIEDFRRTAKEGQPGQADLFSDFNGLPEDFDKRVDFYRLMAARFPYYLLADSPDGERKEAEITGQLPGSVILRSEATKNLGILPSARSEATKNPEMLRSAQHDNHGGYDIKKGFVYKRVPHVTLKSIANNPDIKEGLSRAEIDAAIARHASTELLYDQPYEDNKRIRVTGPFTVESLSPHRVLSPDEELPAAERKAQQAPGPRQFETMILDNLRKAGVQNYEKGTRLKFDRLEPYAGLWIHAAGEYTESRSPERSEGESKRVAVSIGPEHGTVGPDQVKEAAKEAVQGVGFDLLIVCGFAFDPHVSEEAKRYGKLMVMPTRMNYDLTMGDDLLKKTGAGNLFMYFGEPDIEVKRVPSSVTLSRFAPLGTALSEAKGLTAGSAKGLSRKGRDSSASPQNDKGEQLVVTIKGLDIYDPTTGQIRSHSTDDIACWFIDTNYNGESFFVRHAYFTGAEEPYEKLKRALRAEIDEAAWSALYSTVSRPFDPPKTGKLAVKVINHYGDEVLKVYDAR